MLYAILSGTRTIVGAADDAPEFGWLSEDAEGWLPRLHEGCFRPGSVEMQSEPLFAGLRLPPYVFQHADVAQRDEFAAARGLKVLTLAPELAAAQKRMLSPGAAQADPEEDGRTIAEIDGLDEHDPWDRRTDEQKAQDEEWKKKAKLLEAAGAISDDSFAAPGAGVDDASGVHVSGVRARVEDDGSITVLSASAVKEGDDATGPGVLVDPDGKARVFHLIAVVDAKLAAVVPVLASAELDDTTVVIQRIDTQAGCRLAVVRGSTAVRIKALLEAEGFAVDVSTVNSQAEALLPQGTVVVEAQDSVEQPRPWNGRAGEIDAMDEAAREANRATLVGEEFLFTGDYGVGGNCEVYVVPASHFRASGEFWPEPLDIATLLPADMEEVSAGHYRCRGRAWMTVSLDLIGRGFTESLMLRLHINNL